jgi:hypothetical protein
MSESALKCPKCGSPSVRRSRRANPGEMTKMMAGVYPFRCNSCNERFWASVWLFSIWRWAKCPRCLNVSLTDWPNRHYHVSAWTELMTAIGAKKHRCSRCRHNFTSFRPRLPETESELAEHDEIDTPEEQRGVPVRPPAAKT